jgi:hypothetical protein
MARIFSKGVVQVKKVILKGALDLKLLFQGNEEPTLGRRTLLEVLTSKDSLFKGI